MKAIVYAKKYENNLLCDCEVNTVRCVHDADYENNIETIKHNPDKYTLIGTVDLDAEDVIRQSVLAFNELLAKCYPCSIRLYISQNSNKAEVGPVNRNFLNDWNFSTSRDFKLLLARFLSDLGFDIDYMNDRNIIITKRG